MPNRKTMKAAVVEKFVEPLVVREVPIPTPGPGQALVQVFATGVCHTDLQAVDGDWPVKPRMPLIAALGTGVTHLKEGDRVGIAWLHSACGHCDYYLAGWETLCAEQQNSGYSVNGTFVQYAWGQADCPVPRTSPFWMRPRSCARASPPGLKMTEARPDEWVVISGVGGMGHVAIQYAKAMGLHVAAVDLGPEKMALARKLGAEITMDAKTQDPAKEIQNKSAGRLERW
jgi:propanol-preferring alcohol dehydrogenase